MNVSSKTTIGEIQAMSPVEQINALGQIWDSIARNNSQMPLSNEERAILSHRLESEKDAPARAWREVRDEIEQKFT